MRVAVYFREYEQVHQNKDPGQLVLGLVDVGVDAEIVTVPKAGAPARGPIPIRWLDGGPDAERAFWRRQNYRAVIAYTWLRADRAWIPDLLASAGVPTVIKGDTDGRIAFPLHPRWDLFQGPFLGLWPSANIVRRRLLRRLKRGEHYAALTKQIACACATVVESPRAMANLSLLLSAAGSDELISKVHVIPNPVSPETGCHGQKEKLVVAVGNWTVRFGDYVVKNPGGARAALSTFLRRRPDYRAVVVGQGADVIRPLLAGGAGSVGDRIEVRGERPHEEVLKLLSAARIFFMPSFSEAFPIAAAEAAASGCGIVGGPLEALEYLTAASSCGTVAADFSDGGLAAALLLEAQEWDRGRRNSQAGGQLWRERLARQQVGVQYRNLIEQSVVAPVAGSAGASLCPESNAQMRSDPDGRSRENCLKAPDLPSAGPSGRNPREAQPLSGDDIGPAEPCLAATPYRHPASRVTDRTPEFSPACPMQIRRAPYASAGTEPIGLPPVGVVILNWNNAADTIRCVTSVLASSGCKARVIVTDNGSTDDSVLQILSWSKGHEIPAGLLQGGLADQSLTDLTGDGLIVVANPYNAGFAMGNNIGLRIALALGLDYIFLLNNDCVVHPAAIAELVAYGERHKPVALMAPAVSQPIDGSFRTVDPSELRRPPSLLSSLVPFSRENGRRTVSECKPVQPMQVYYAPGCAMMFRASTLNIVGLLDEQTFLYFEEYIVAERLKKAGLPTHYVPSAHVYHAQGATTSMLPGGAQYRHSLRSQIYYFRHVRNISRVLVILLCFKAVATAAGRAIWRADYRKDIFRFTRDCFRTCTGDPRIHHEHG